jgi:DME family drug/metabolite transporter
VNPALRSRLALIAAAVLFSTAGAAIKSCALTGWQVASFRALVAGIVVAVALPESRRGWTRRTVLVAVAYAATAILFVQANKLTTAASTIFIQAASPLFIAALAPWLLGEWPRRRDLPFMAAILAGLALFFAGGPQEGHATAPDPRLGNLVAIASSFSVALMMMGLRWLGREEHGSATGAVVLGNFLAFAAALPFAFPVQARSGDVAIVLYLGVFQIGLAYPLMLLGLRRVSALEASLLMFVEPVLSPLWAWLLHGEGVGPWALAGGALILVATAIKTAADSRRPALAAAS